ncbi:hypothetical protein GCM10025876_10560 [Demequina litorisediminis]|uniref:ABC transporter domain-containing protein n=1 Tax=Demequina litorisediminis TaxID=1849022 RepID=A0ABQ6ICW8_9MICO|nr:hypothetical protein GCM10025876_10560 [Demequina litorisediminis]
MHALLGENGAGKSTLMNVLFGLYDADGGTIALDDEPVVFAGPGDAMAAGIGMVHQHFMLVPVFTVAESVMLGHEEVRGPAKAPRSRLGPRPRQGDLGQVWLPHRSGRRHRGPVRRSAAARGDHQGAVSGRQGADS